MNYEEVFLDSKRLPKRILTDEELKQLMIMIENEKSNPTPENKRKSDYAKNKITRYNIRLLISTAMKYIDKSNSNLKELVAIGSVGLAKAINGFDYRKNYKFSTFLVKCIENEIKNYLKFESKFQYEENGEVTDYLLTISPDQRIICSETPEEIYLNKEAKMILIQLLEENLDSIKLKIMKMYCGIGCRRYTQREIGDEFGFSKANVSLKVIESEEILRKLYLDYIRYGKMPKNKVLTK